MIELTEDQAKRIVEHIYDAEGDKMGSYVSQASVFVNAVNGDAECGIEIAARGDVNMWVDRGDGWLQQAMKLSDSLGRITSSARIATTVGEAWIETLPGDREAWSPNTRDLVDAIKAVRQSLDREESRQ